MAPENDFSSIEQRSELLDPDLINHSASKDWVFYILAAQKDALDIIWTTLQENLVQRQAWTQGKNYRFSVGDTFYDTPLAYTDWSKGLKVMGTCLQVIRSQFANAKTLGKVEFLIYRPTSDTSRLIAHRELSCTQVEFKNLLKYGTLHNTRHQDL